MKMSADEVNVDLFNEVKRLKEKCEIASLELEIAKNERDFARNEREIANLEIAILKNDMILVESLLGKLIHDKKKVGKAHLINVYKEVFNSERLKDLQKHAKGWSIPEVTDVVIKDGFLIIEGVNDDD
ncbi:hypothetical protein C6Y02_16870 [Bacillus sp. NMCC4]|uniref:hypothetical protein n=1 Tax=Bacillus sp. NMCC4 TaxID=2108539 RepID=UPI000D03969B|nr:hypothetical protein [Bacillus sp. NMCC4]PRS35686.1 hypothetical protein C6Y02_16870 [Bacillus sp. NMCC4]